MKKTLSIFALLLTGFICSAQNYKAIPDSLICYLGEYAEGRITFVNGESGNGVLNICTLDQAVRFIENGKIMALGNNDQVSKVTIGPSLFVKNRENYVQILKVIDGIGLGITKNLYLMQKPAEGAFGGHDETTSVTKYGSLGITAGEFNRSINKEDNSEYYNITEPIHHPYDYKEHLFLYKNGKFTPVSRKAFEKLFSAKKDVVASYVEEHQVRFYMTEDVIGLFSAME